MSTRKKAPLPTRFAGPGDSPGFLLWRVSNAWQRRQRAALQPLELTHSQFVILAAATWFGGDEGLAQGRLGELVGADAMTTSQVVRALESQQLLQRKENPDDPRAWRVVATSSGRALAARAVSVVEQVDADFFAPVAGQSRTLVKLLRSLAG